MVVKRECKYQTNRNFILINLRIKYIIAKSNNNKQTTLFQIPVSKIDMVCKETIKRIKNNCNIHLTCLVGWLAVNDASN